MPDTWLPLKDIPAEGRDFSFQDPVDWPGRFAAFGMPFTLDGPLELDLHVARQGEGVLVRGRLTGSVVTPCDRCAEAAQVTVDESFEQFEPFPGHGLEDEEAGESHVEMDETGSAPRLNVSEVAWEQFVLALPRKPLCAARCKGLCPRCGANLNLGACGCSTDEGDPRLSVLRGLKITPKQ